MPSQSISITHLPVGNISVEDTSTHLRLLLSGDIDEQLRAEASAALARVSIADMPVTLDATHLHAIDPTGLAFLWQILEVAEEQSLPVTLYNAPEQLRAGLIELGLESHFVLTDD